MQCLGLFSKPKPKGRAMAQAVSRAVISPRRPGFDPRSDHVGFVVDKVALGQVFPPEYFGFTLSISFQRCSVTWKNENKNLSSLSSSQGCTISLRAAVRP